MTLEEVYFISEIVATVFVVLSLIAVAIQLNQNTKAVRSSAAMGVSLWNSQAFTTLSQDADQMRVFVQGGSNIDSLDPLDRARYFSMLNGSVWNWQNMYFQWKQNVLDPELWESQLRLLTNVTSLPGFRTFWAERRDMYSDEFSAFMETEAFTRKALADFRPMGYPAEDE